MPNGKGRRWFGTIRKLPSGRYQARYWGPDGVRRSADDTFATKAAAQDWLTLKEAELLEGEWIDPDAGAVFVADYAATWIGEHPGLRRSMRGCCAVTSRRTSSVSLSLRLRWRGSVAAEEAARFRRERGHRG